VALLSVLVAALMGPAVAVGGDAAADATAAARRPDARIRYDTFTESPWIGNNVYNTTAAHQKKGISTFNPSVGSTIDFGISVQNDGTR
jgi:hypothetical protein